MSNAWLVKSHVVQLATKLYTAILHFMNVRYLQIQYQKICCRLVLLTRMEKWYNKVKMESPDLKLYHLAFICFLDYRRCCSVCCSCKLPEMFKKWKTSSPSWIRKNRSGYKRRFILSVHWRYIVSNLNLKNFLFFIYRTLWFELSGI
jgi:hypothetical protein